MIHTCEWKRLGSGIWDTNVKARTPCSEGNALHLVIGNESHTGSYFHKLFCYYQSLLQGTESCRCSSMWKAGQGLLSPLTRSSTHCEGGSEKTSKLGMTVLDYHLSMLGAHTKKSVAFAIQPFIRLQNGRYEDMEQNPKVHHLLFSSKV